MSLATNLLNLVLDPLLIFGCGPVPAMGVAGAALATAISECSAGALYLWLLLRRRLVRCPLFIYFVDTYSSNEFGPLCLHASSV